MQKGHSFMRRDIILGKLHALLGNAWLKVFFFKFPPLDFSFANFTAEHYLLSLGT